MPRYTSIIADDHAIVRAGLRAALEAPGMVTPEGLEVAAETADGAETIAAVRSLKPHILFLDVQMPLAGGTEIALETRRWSPATKVVVLTGISSVGKLSELVEIGVDGLFSKATPNDELYASIPKILAGMRCVSSHVLALLENAPDAAALTGRERQILNLIALGQSNKEIGAVLGISAKTVDRHRTLMMSKLGVHSVAQLVAHALKQGLLDGSPEL